MKILVVPDKFKGSLSAAQAAQAIARGVKRAAPMATVELLPVADGGEGTVETLVLALGGKRVSTRATGPLGDPVEAVWGIVFSADHVKTAIIEMSSASGLQLVKNNHPLEATTFGTGELIKEALRQGCRRVIIGIGGSATTDGGVGMAQALGVVFLDAEGAPLNKGGGCLGELTEIDMGFLDKRVADSEFLVACDVNNPLYGSEGAAHIYGPQKGATQEQVHQLDHGLRNLASVIADNLGIKTDLIPGAGAAGGLGAGLVAFAGAKLLPGFQVVSEAVGLPDRLGDADLIFTGEGRIDEQSLFGKVPVGVGRLAKARKVPVIALAGSIGVGAEAVYSEGVSSISSICPGPISEREAIEKAASLIEMAAERSLRTILAGRLIRDD